MYVAPMWVPCLSSADWQRIGKPQVLMLLQIIRSKPSVPPIARAEFFCLTHGNCRIVPRSPPTPSTRIFWEDCFRRHPPFMVCCSALFVLSPVPPYKFDQHCPYSEDVSRNQENKSHTLYMQGKAFVANHLLPHVNGEPWEKRVGHLAFPTSSVVSCNLSTFLSIMDCHYVDRVLLFWLRAHEIFHYMIVSISPCIPEN